MTTPSTRINVKLRIGATKRLALTVWQNKALAVPLDLTGATLDFTFNNLGFVPTPDWTDRVAGKFSIVLAATDTITLDPGTKHLTPRLTLLGGDKVVLNDIWFIVS